MTSIKSRLVQGAMRRRHLLKGKIRKEVMGEDEAAVLAFRQQCEEGAARFAKLPVEIKIEEEMIHMVSSEWIIPPGAPAGKLIFYVHGGGYVSGSCNDHRSIVAKFAMKTGVTCLLYEYGLAPEDPFPAALYDSLSVYQAILEKGYDPQSILIMGESAGAGLNLAVLLALKDRKLPLPCASVAIQPWTDLSCSGASYHTKNRKSLAPLNSWIVFRDYYVGENDVYNPYISPAFGDMEGLPPLFLSVGEDDELYDDAMLFYRKAKDAGVDIKLQEGKAMVHCYPLLDPLFPEATSAMNEIIDFIKCKLKV